MRSRTKPKVSRMRLIKVVGRRGSRIEGTEASGLIKLTAGVACCLRLRGGLKSAILPCVGFCNVEWAVRSTENYARLASTARAPPAAIQQHGDDSLQTRLILRFETGLSCTFFIFNFTTFQHLLCPTSCCLRYLSTDKRS